TNYGKVWMLTALAQTKTGARAMAQMEVASPVLGYASAGGFGLLGPNPTIGQMPNSNNFYARGNDANSCGEIAQPDHPAIAGYDDPNASPPTNSVQTIVNSLPRPDHYIGAGGTPSVQNGFGSFGETMSTPTGLKSMIDAIHAVASTNGTLYGNNPGSIAHGDATHPVVDYVDGNLTGSGSTNFGLSYDHCWSDDLMHSIPFTPPPTTKPLKILSLRLLPY